MTTMMSLSKIINLKGPLSVSSFAQGKFQPVDQVVKDEDFPACPRLLNCTRTLASLHHIAEEKGEIYF